MILVGASVKLETMNAQQPKPTRQDLDKLQAEIDAKMQRLLDAKRAELARIEQELMELEIIGELASREFSEKKAPAAEAVSESHSASTAPNAPLVDSVSQQNAPPGERKPSMTVQGLMAERNLKNAQTTLFGKPPRPWAVYMNEALDEMAPMTKFTIGDFCKKLVAKHPSFGSRKVRHNIVGNYLWRTTNAERITIFEKGAGTRPSIYQKLK